jgi:hypothetical protein
MGFGNVTTTAGGAGFQHQTFATTRPGDFGGYDTTATNGGTTSGNGGTVIIPGPWLCVETSSELMIVISLSIEQSISRGPSLETMVSFGIFGDIVIDGKSNRECMPKKAAEDEVAAGRGCTALVHQKYTAVSMAGNPPMYYPMGGGSSAGRGGRLFKWVPKVVARNKILIWPAQIWKYRPAYGGAPVAHTSPEHYWWAGPGMGNVRFFRSWPPGKLVWDNPNVWAFRPATYFEEQRIVWEKVHLWNDGLLGFIMDLGSFNHNFDIDLGYIKNCGPKICYDCPTPEGLQTFSENCRPRILHTESPIEITGNMSLKDWLSDQDSSTQHNGYLSSNDPYWYTGSIYPEPSRLAELWKAFDWSIGDTVATNPLIASEGPAYARYPGFGADIFEGRRQNSVSQGLHQIKLELQNVLANAVTTWEGGLPSGDPDIFCGDMDLLTPANIEAILADFQNQWKEQSLANDKAMLSPPPPGGNVPGMSEGY